MRWRWILAVATALPSSCAPPPPMGAASPPAAAETDGDGDGVTHDRCPTAPEDHDGHEDEDGCPEADPPATCVDEEGNLCLSE